MSLSTSECKSSRFLISLGIAHTSKRLKGSFLLCSGKLGRPGNSSSKSLSLHDILRNTSVANIYRYVPTTFYTEFDVNSEIDREEQNNRDSSASNEEGRTGKSPSE
jgi:hypothetical protein